MFLGRKIGNSRQIPNEGFLFNFFLEITKFLRQKLNSVHRSGSLSYFGLESGPRYEKG